MAAPEPPHLRAHQPPIFRAHRSPISPYRTCSVTAARQAHNLEEWCSTPPRTTIISGLGLSTILGRRGPWHRGGHGLVYAGVSSGSHIWRDTYDQGPCDQSLYIWMGSLCFIWEETTTALRRSLPASHACQLACLAFYRIPASSTPSISNHSESTSDLSIRALPQ